MKSFLIGCGVVAIILIVLIGVGGFFIVKTGKVMVAEMETAQHDLESLNSDFPFTPPADGELAEPRLVLWLNVRDALLAADKRFYEKFQKNGALAVAQMPKMLPEMLKEAARALRQEKMSPAEYAWITDQVMGALKSRAAENDPKLAELAAMAGEPSPEIKSGKSQFRQDRQREFVPLAPEEARPILDLIRRHESRVRKVIYVSMSDGMLEGVLDSHRHRAPRKGKAPAATDAATSLTTASAAVAP